jgi:dTDP-glucose 4,6-dehydratase
VTTKRVLLTGSSGLLGSHTLKRILQTTDWDVVCLSTFNHTGIQDRVIEAAKLDTDEYRSRVKVLICDLSSPISSVTKSKIGKIDYVINFASESHVTRSIDNPTPFILNNVQLICNLLDWARENPVEKFLHISTDEVFGPYQNRDFTEWDPHLPSNPYSASKAAQENIAFSYWRTYGVPVGIVNIMNIVGEYQNVEKYTPMIMKKVMNDEVLDVHTYDNGTKIGRRSWLYVGNMASAVLHILDQQFDSVNESNKLSRWNIAGDGDYSNLEWAEKIAGIVGKELKYRLVDTASSRPGYDASYALNNKKLLDSGWTPPYNLDEALVDVVNWYKEHPEWL